MFCRNCKTPLTQDENICHNCGVPKGTGYKYCDACGNNTAPDASFCPKCGAKLCPRSKSEKVIINGKKSKIIAGILGIILGGLGIHNFYLGFTNKAIIQLALTVGGAVLSIITCGITSIFSLAASIWGFVEGILILCGNIKYDADGIELVD